MNSKFKLKVNGNFETGLSTEAVQNSDIIKTSEGHYHLVENDRSITAEISSANFNKKQYTVTINHNQYAVTIENELDQLIDKMGFSLSSVKHIDNIKAPMPGLILEVSVTPGQEVKEDDPLLILEAMKMENVITSPRHGTIKGVSVAQGEAVQKNQLLIEFE